jgi:hypothetical protein
MNVSTRFYTSRPKFTEYLSGRKTCPTKEKGKLNKHFMAKLIIVEIIKQFFYDAL